EYAVEFRNIAADLRYGQEALIDAFRRALNHEIQDHLISYKEPLTLSDVIQMSVRIDNRIATRQGAFRSQCNHSQRGRAATGESGPTSSASTPLGTISAPNVRPKLRDIEKKRRRDQGLCL
ncbi:hypothetical protein BDZ88DRAFT_401576, partial [Geranomyces variabilis]